MKKFMLGIAIGVLFGSSVSWAAYTHLTLVNRAGNDIGTTANPIYVETV